MNYHGIFGFDISTYQDAPSTPAVVNFQKMRDYGGRFVIIKAGQGNWPDPDFETNWRNAKGILPRATYWYLDNRYPPKEQARKYFEIIRQDLEGMCWVDIEDKQAGLYEGWRNWYDFCEELKAVYPGVRIGIYTGFYVWWEYITFAMPAQRDYFKQYPLWLANYQTDPYNPAYNTILVPLPWLEYAILQSGTPAIGHDVGVESAEIDYNQFNGDENAFIQMFGGKPQEGSQMATGKVLVNLNIRPTAGTQYAYIGQLAPNDIVEGTVANGWWKLTGWKRGGLTMTLPRLDCYAYEGANQGYIQTIVQPPQPPAQTFPAEMGVTIGGVTKTYVLKA